MFGVIICPKCHRARGVSLSTKRAECSHCGHSIDISLARVYHRTESQEELVLAVQKVTERLAVNVEDYPAERKRRSRPVVPPKAKRTCSSEEELRRLIDALTAGRGEFTVQDVMSKLEVVEEEAAKVVQRMLDSGLVFEPSMGRFKVLPG